MSNPTIKYSLAKYLDKGEDTWTQQPTAELNLNDSHDKIKAALFAVFDGHGGKAAATFASRGLLTRLQSALKSPPVDSTDAQAPGNPSKNRDGFHDAVSHAFSISSSSESQAQNDEVGPPALQKPSASRAATEAAEVAKLKAQALNAGMGAEAVKFNDTVDDVTAALPTALVTAFENTQADFFTHSQTSGSTATVVIVSGWEVIVANVGDSLAYVDTGSEVVQVSGNHRLDDSQTEQDRILAAGAEVAQSEVNGRGVGPLRVWPGGLAMGRTLGDASGGDAVLCTPEIRQITLPQSGGRVIVASDGLWDLLSPKTAAHHVRGLPASKAAAELVALAARNKKPRDDITVIVVDAMPPGSETARYPPLLARSKGRHPMTDGSSAQPVDLFWPLEGEGASQWRRTAWTRRVAVAVEAQQHTMRLEAAAQAAEAAAADVAAKAEVAAGSSVSSVTSAGSISTRSQSGMSEGSEGEVQYASELHRQMAMLQLDPSEYETHNGSNQPESQSQEASDSEEEPEKVAVEEEWETVAPKLGRLDDRGTPTAVQPADDANHGRDSHRQPNRQGQNRNGGRGGGPFHHGAGFDDRTRGRGRGRATGGRGRGRGQQQARGLQQHGDEASKGSSRMAIAAQDEHGHINGSNTQHDDASKQPAAPPLQAQDTQGNDNGDRGRAREGHVANRMQRVWYDHGMDEAGRGGSRFGPGAQARRGRPSHQHQQQQQEQQHQQQPNGGSAQEGYDLEQQYRYMYGGRGRGRNRNRGRIESHRHCEGASHRDILPDQPAAQQQQQQQHPLQRDSHHNSNAVPQPPMIPRQQVLPFTQAPFRVPESLGPHQPHPQHSSLRQHPAEERAPCHQFHQSKAYESDEGAIRGCSFEHSTSNAFGAGQIPAHFVAAESHHPQQHHEFHAKALPLQFGTFDNTTQITTVARPQKPLRFGSFGDEILGSGPPQAMQRPALKGTGLSSDTSAGQSAASDAIASLAKTCPANCWATTVGSEGGATGNGPSQQLPAGRGRGRKRNYGGRGNKSGRGRGHIAKQQHSSSSACPVDPHPYSHPRHSERA